MNKTILNYMGNVVVKLKIGDKIVKLENKNSGTEALMKLLCRFLTSNTPSKSETPQFLDLQYNSNAESDEKVWESYLSTPISLSGKVYKYEDGNWVAKFTAVLYHNNLLNDISESDSGEFRFVLTSGYSSDEDIGSYVPLAALSVEAYTLARITPGTQAIIEWTMQIKNA